MEKSTTVLPPDFDGVFRFTNPSDEDFTAKWNSREYVYPANSTSPMIIVDATPVEIQNIRKKFARELAEREIGKSEKVRRLEGTERANNDPRFNSFHQAGSYDLKDLEPYIQKCLTPLPVAQAMVREVERAPVESKLSRDEEGELRTVAVDKKISLKKKAEQM